jgi:putative endonuclease
MPKVFTSKTQKIGELGENIAVKFLVKHNFVILERNYTKKWGELDIIAEKEEKIYFIEVKSVARETLNDVIHDITTQARKYNNGKYRPEENMHPRKLQRMSRAIQTYILSRKNTQGREWQVDLLIIYLDLNNKKAKIKVVENIIL